MFMCRGCELRRRLSSWTNPIDMTQDLFEGDAWNFVDDVLMGEHAAEGSVGPGRGDIAPLPTFSDYQEDVQVHQAKTETDVYAPVQGKRRILHFAGTAHSVRVRVCGVACCRRHPMPDRLGTMPCDEQCSHDLSFVALLSCLSIPRLRYVQRTRWWRLLGERTQERCGQIRPKEGRALRFCTPNQRQAYECHVMLKRAIAGWRKWGQSVVGSIFRTA